MIESLLEQELNEAFALLRRDGYEPNVHGTVLCSFRSATL